MILKSPKSQENNTRKLLFASAARVAWQHLMEAIDVAPGFKVLLPGYIGFTEREGSGVFDPIEATGVAHSFYTIREDLSIDMADFERQLQAGDVRVALVIHYFGFCQNDIDAVAALCRQHEVLLVEDCAHAFQLGLPNQRLGTNGDFSFYSLHKYLATDTGGILQINRPDFAIAALPEASRIDPAVMEQCIKTDIIRVAEIRRSNYALYFDNLKDLPGLEIMFPLGPDDVPHNFAMKVKEGRREKLYFYLMEREIPTIALYYRMIDQISRDAFPESFRISDSILNLPVHQDISEADVLRICSEIKGFFNQS